MNQRLWCLTSIALAVLLSSACASPKSAQVEAEPAQEAPEDAKPAPIPQGPEVAKDGIRPQQTRETVDSPAAEDAGSSVTRQEIERFRDRGPAYVLTLMQFEPVHGDAGFQGFKIVEARDNARQFMTPLMQMGDVITHINGVRIERPDDFLQAWKTLEDASVIRIDLVRDESPMNVTWAIEE